MPGSDACRGLGSNGRFLGETLTSFIYDEEDGGAFADATLQISGQIHRSIVGSDTEQSAQNESYTAAHDGYSWRLL